MVHVVFPYTGNSNVYAHEVIVRSLEDNGVQYVSNRVIPSVNNHEETCHAPRLTEEEWENECILNIFDHRKEFIILIDCRKDAS